MVKTLPFQRREPGFDPLSGDLGYRILHSLLSEEKQKDQVVTMYPVSIQETLVLEGSVA